MKKLLVIDDDQTFCDLIKANAGTAQYEVTTAADGVEGLSALEKAIPDLILLDIRMPRMDGIEFMERLKNTHADKKIPIIITSNDSSLDTISKGAEFGIRGYIVKSSQPMKTIIETIDRVIAETDK